MTLTSVFKTLEEPTFIYSPFSNTLKSLDWVSRGNSATSSKKIVPPLVTSKYPFLASEAPVKAPFSWPKSSGKIFIKRLKKSVI